MTLTEILLFQIMKKLIVDIDKTICITKDGDYANSKVKKEVVNKLFESFPGKMLWTMDGEALENTNEYEKVNIFYL